MWLDVYSEISDSFLSFTISTTSSFSRAEFCRESESWDDKPAEFIRLTSAWY